MVSTLYAMIYIRFTDYERRKKQNQMKKFLALVMVGVMTIGTAVFAAPSPSSSAVSAESSSTKADPAAALEAAASSEGLSVQEYLNNAVTNVPGLAAADVAPMGIPKGAIINGVNTNFSVRIAKPSKAQVQAGQKAISGKILNVLGIANKPAGTVQIAIYCKAIKADSKVGVYQLINGQLVKLVSSVRAEHVDVVLQGNGPVFVVAE